MKNILKFKTVFFTTAIAFSFAFLAYAANPFDIKFPIPELGNCGSLDQCKAYCDDLSHGDVCAAFGQKYGLTDKTQVAQAQALKDGGPGGCQTTEACKTYCADQSHADECLSFAEKHGLISKDDAVKAKKLAGKSGPGGCKGEECKTYCEKSENHDECFKFAEDNGFINKEDAKQIDRGKAVIEKLGGGPGGCKSENECKTYCQDSAHLDECLDFGVKNGFMTSDEAVRIKKLGGFNKGPGDCKSEAECRAFCDNPDNAQTCVSWGEQNGYISKEEAAKAQKFANQTGPGGCRGQSECQAYCQNQSHREECVTWGVENGFISKDEAQRALKFANQTGPGGCKGEECRAYCEKLENHDECFKFAKENNLISKEEIKQGDKFKQIRETVNQNGGPGGCKDENSCRSYCSDATRSEECLNFAVQKGGFSKDEAQKSLEQFKQLKDYGQQLRNNHEQFIGVSQGDFQQFQQKFQQSGVSTSVNRFPPPGFNQSFGQQSFGGQPGTSNPGGCSNPQQCADYCSNPDHKEECVSRFRRGEPQNQNSTPSSAAQVENGPGGCHGLRECLRYCRTHQQECNTEEENQQGNQNRGEPQGNNNNENRQGSEGREFNNQGKPFLNNQEGEFTKPRPPENRPQPICPAVVSVDQCPPGQVRFQVQNSPECGTFYTCRTETNQTPPPSTDPVTGCAQIGGVWDTAAHYCKMPGQTPPLPSPTPSPSPSTDPAIGCAQVGGTWDATTHYCKMPSTTTTPPPSYTTSPMPPGSYPPPMPPSSYPPPMPPSGSYPPPMPPPTSYRPSLSPLGLVLQPLLQIFR